MRFSHAMSIGLGLCLVATDALPAQRTELFPGARVRMRVPPGGDRVDGTIIARDPDSIVVATRLGVQHRVALSSLASVDLYRGRSRTLGAKKGALWGAAVIAVPMALIIATSHPERDHWSRSDELRFAFYITRIYAATGATIGAFVRADSWQRCARLTAATCDSHP